MNDRPRRKGAGRRRGGSAAAPLRAVDYRSVNNSFMRQPAFSKDRVEAIHSAALKVLEELGVRVLDDEARRILHEAGARVDESDQMVRIDRALVAGALASAPRTFEIHGGSPGRCARVGGDAVLFLPVGGPPYVNDLERGKRPGTLEDARHFFKLSQSFDVIHMLAPCVEPQDIGLAQRHLRNTESQLCLSDKAPFVFARGGAQVKDCFEMIRIARGVDAQRFSAQPFCYTVINTNSPRQLDVPMCQGIIDFARAGQCAVITPFTLSGAMAPVTIPGALTLQHAEALAGIALSQAVRPGAPVVYGSFTSNVDMKSGSPAFGTPEFVKGAMGAGQLARRVGLPWRGSAATASNAPDEQAVYETMMSLWGGVLGGINLVQHAAGWLEGGLSASPEKFVLDVEVLQMLAESMVPLDAGDAEIGFDAIAEVEPGGHFFPPGTPWSATRVRSTSPWCRTGATSATGRSTGRRPRWSAPTASGSGPSPTSNHRPWTRRGGRSSRNLSPGVVHRAGRCRYPSAQQVTVIIGDRTT